MHYLSEVYSNLQWVRISSCDADGLLIVTVSDSRLKHKHNTQFEVIPHSWLENKPITWFNIYRPNVAQKGFKT